MRTKTMPTHLCNLARGWSGLGRLWRRGRRALAVIFLIWVVTLAPLPWPVTPVMGATYTVDRTDDPSPPATACTAAPNDCSLRGAIIAANATPAADTIVLQSGQTYTLSLEAMGSPGDEDTAAEDDLDIADATTAGTLTIQGNGATIRRDPALTCNLDGTVAVGEFRIFEVHSGGNLTLQNVRVTNGCADGGSFPDNSGGGILNALGGTATITNSTISGNRARGFGGGIYNQEGTVNASFVTIAKNSASGQGGGIFIFVGTVNIKNSIVGNNTGGADCSGSINDIGGNYDSDGSCFGMPGDAIFLGPLRNNGGPTQTHALLAGDPLDGAADCTDVSNNQVNADQRGSPRPRPVGGQCDAGAYEVQNPRTLSVTISGNGTVTSNPGRINCSTGNTGTCTETYEQNTIVQLTAAAGSGSVFAGWSNNCSGASNTVTVTMNTDKACTATFVQPGTIVIQKTAIEDNGTFGFSGSGGIGSFSITTSSGSGARSFSLAPGTYTVTENTPPTGWAFQRLVCTDPDGGTTVDLNTRTATIDLDAGETVTCTFTNTRLGR